MHSIHRLLRNSANSSAGKTAFYVAVDGDARPTNHWAAAKLGCVLFLACGVSLAQRVVIATANTPFDVLGGRSEISHWRVHSWYGFPAWPPDNRTPCCDLQFPQNA